MSRLDKTCPEARVLLPPAAAVSEVSVHRHPNPDTDRGNPNKCASASAAVEETGIFSAASVQLQTSHICCLGAFYRIGAGASGVPALILGVPERLLL